MVTCNELSVEMILKKYQLVTRPESQSYIFNLFQYSYADIGHTD